MPTDPFTHAMTATAASGGWGPWRHEVEEQSEGPGLLVSRMFWLGGGASLLLWGCVTWLAVSFT